MKKVGDQILYSGILVTARDKVCARLVATKRSPFPLEGAIVYHAGPVVTKKGGRWKIEALGPTTSLRMEAYTHDLMNLFGIQGFIGKGGLGERSSKAFKQYGGFYASALGGGGQLLADSVIQVIDCFFLEEFGPADAMWVVLVKDFPMIVTMDEEGNSLHNRVEKNSKENFRKIADNR